MTLGKIIKEYREMHNLSQRQFALLCNVSNGYISMLEEDRNPKTNEAIIPSLVTMKKLSKAMGMTLNDLMNKVDDMEISLRDKKVLTQKNDARTTEFIALFEKLTAEQQTIVISQIKGILLNQKSNKELEEFVRVYRAAHSDDNHADEIVKMSKKELQELKDAPETDDLI